MTYIYTANHERSYGLGVLYVMKLLGGANRTNKRNRRTKRKQYPPLQFAQGMKRLLQPQPVIHVAGLWANRNSLWS